MFLSVLSNNFKNQSRVQASKATASMFLLNIQSMVMINAKKGFGLRLAQTPLNSFCILYKKIL